jgi:S1-C subfamily serine protease
MKKMALTILLAAAVAAGLAAVVGGFAFGRDNTSAAAAAGGTVLTPQEIYQSDAPGVVVITATQTQTVPGTLLGPPVRARVAVLGSGFVIDDQGDILTNDHVVQGGTGIRVEFSSGTKYPATVVDTDPSNDLAVVHVQAPASELYPLAFDDSSAVQVGDPAYAIGNPFGLERSMTAGIVSATGRDIQSPDGGTISNAIQTDAPINQGNSGGPLLDGYGRVIGVNEQIEGTGPNGGSVGIAFAIPSNTAKSVADQLIANGSAKRASLGAQAPPAAPADRRRAGPRH